MESVELDVDDEAVPEDCVDGGEACFLFVFVFVVVFVFVFISVFVFVLV
jgi:hypothetical protein